MSFSIEALQQVIQDRLNDPEAASYTRTLAAKGVDKCAEKFGEEAIETVIAAVQRDSNALTAEAADVMYHLVLLLAVSGLSWSDVLKELEKRTMRSGLEEKASRQAG